MKLLPFILTLFSISHLIAQPTEIKIWPKGVPNAIENANYKEEVVYSAGSPRISKVINPTLTAYLVPKEKATGAAVIICPGGGYGRLAIDHEGYKVAEWFNSIGVSAFVLKYRLPHDSIMKNKAEGPLQDAQEAIRIVRRNANKWNISTSSIGIMGFSAGGHLASTASTHFNEKVYEVTDTVSARPDFSILIYPVVTMDTANTHSGSRVNLIGKKPSSENVNRFSNELRVTSTTPAFVVHSFDDKTVPVQNSVNYVLALKRNNVSAELHVYEKGGHGYGLAIGKGTESGWPTALYNWLKIKKLAQ